MTFSWQTIGTVLCCGVVMGVGSPAIAQRITPHDARVENTLNLIAQSAIPSGWQVIQGNGVALALPNSYYGGNPSTDLERIEEQLGEVIPDSAQRVNIIRQSPIPFALVAFHSQVDSQGTLASVNITSAPIPPNTEISTYLDATAELLSQRFEVLQREIVRVNNISSGRIVTQASITTQDNEKQELQQLLYLIPGRDRVYIVVFSSSVVSFPQQLPVFEQSIETLAF
ncbi:hypothetical protein [Spirulina subsalsa]|uniref:hypothetical protein n=1 Tax=Spirulina subsalsa TaxID=54311 RepID=UPI0002E34970|nr:hypothetical protein [Spirulina subsalsa]